MNQLRLDPLSGRWVVVSSGRAERPYSFVTRSRVPDTLDRPCPFCPGNEEETPPALETYGPTGSWLVRVVPNLYPAFDGDEPFVVANRGPVFTQASAGGIHEILIFSPEHDLTLGQSARKVRMSWRRSGTGSRACLPTEPSLHPGHRELGARGGGVAGTPARAAAGDVLHPARAGRGAGPLRPLRGFLPPVHHHRGRGGQWQRVIYSNERVVVVCPFWSSLPYEMLVMPREQYPHLHHSPTEDLIAVGEALRRTLLQLGETVGDVAYNIVFHSAPYRVGEPYHWHAHVWPKATTVAGFELGTGVAINVMSPEEAAETLQVNALV